MKIQTFLFLLLIIGCRENRHPNLENRKVNNDSLKVDSLKWLVYALNNYAKLEAIDSSSSKKVLLNPVACDLQMIYLFKQGDTFACSFKFLKQGYTAIIPTCALPVRGISVLGNAYHVDFYHMLPNFAKYPDSTKLYIKMADSTFKKYLNGYKGDMSFWLKKEAVKRNIIKVSS